MNISFAYLEKECFDKGVIDIALGKIAKNEEVDVNVHFIYTGSHYSSSKGLNRLKSLILDVMEHYKMQSVVLTGIRMKRLYLITPEERDKYCLARANEEQSVNDDLEILLEKSRHRENANEWIETYFFPQLTEEEIQLVSNGDPKYMNTFLGMEFRDPFKFQYGSRSFEDSIDVDEVGMNLSESKLKIVKGRCQRSTLMIKK